MQVLMCKGTNSIKVVALTKDIDQLYLKNSAI